MPPGWKPPIGLPPGPPPPGFKPPPPGWKPPSDWKPPTNFGPPVPPSGTGFPHPPPPGLLGIPKPDLFPSPLNSPSVTPMPKNVIVPTAVPTKPAPPSQTGSSLMNMPPPPIAKFPSFQAEPSTKTPLQPTQPTAKPPASGEAERANNLMKPAV